jgi:protein-disulfide isomerase
VGKKKKKKSAPPVSAPAPASATNRLGVAVAVLLLAGLATAVVLVGRNAPPPASLAPPPEPSDLEKWEAAPLREIPIHPDDPVLGPESAPVTIVEFSDFECPYCREAANALGAMKERRGDEVRLVFKDFPLDTSCNPHISQQIHPLACRAAVLAACAGRQDRFWEMHDAIFALPELTEESLDALPGSLGLDMGSFAACESDEGILASVRSDVELARELGVSGTPTLFVNGRQAPSYHGLDPILDRALSGN